MDIQALKKFELLARKNIENKHYETIPLEEINKKYLEYLEYVNLIHDFVNSEILNNFPFNKCHVNLINDVNEFCDWEFYLESEENLDYKELLNFHSEIVDIIGDFCKENDCLNVFDKIVFVV